MKKLILIFMLGVMLMSGLMAVSFTSPANNAFVAGEVAVEWDNPTDVPAMWLQYAEGNCSASGSWSNEHEITSTTELSYVWDTDNLEGQYCIRLQQGLVTYDSRDLFLDNTAPEADFDVLTLNPIVYEPVLFDGAKSSDVGSGIEFYSWDFDEDGVEDSNLVAPSYTYDEADRYEVTLTVTDYAGNYDTHHEEIVVADLPIEDEVVYEAGIKSLLDLDETFDSGMSSPVTCTYLGTVPTGLFVSNNGDNCTLTWSNIDYDYRGEHSFVIRATDGSDVKYFPIDLIVYTWMIDLTEGWNLVSIPMMPEDSGYQEVLSGVRENLAEVWTYAYSEDDGQNIWHKRATTSSSWSTASSNNKGDLDNVVPGQGYMLKMDAVDTLKGFGNMMPEAGGALLGVEVSNGWNLIGHYGLDDLSYGQALSSLVGNIQYWDLVVSTTGDMKKYIGYWMTAKFLPEGKTLYTPSQQALESVL